jgi:hypothetical protein
LDGNLFFSLYNDGKEDVHKFIELFDSYKIDYLAMDDKDYLNESTESLSCLCEIG